MSMVLLCTVGGSHEPILHAIKSVAPEYVCFFCTKGNPHTGQRGSDVQVVREGKVIKATPKNEKPTLPNIPTQAQIVAADCTGPCQEFARSEASKLRSHADKRNNSILAHGFRPVSEGDWRELASWTSDAFLPMLDKHAAKVGINRELAQLPTRPPVF